jgi:ABC-2 type transport system permease protein
LAVLRKEVLQTVRDKRIMAMLVIAPLLQTIVFGYAVNFDVDRVPTVVVDADRSSDSRKHKQRLLADGTLLLAGEAHDMPAAEAALDSWQAAAIVALRPGFESELLAHRSAEVQVVLDGTDPNRAAVAAAAASRYFGEMAEALVEQQARERGMVRPPEVKVIPRVAYNPSLRTPPYMIPGVMAMLLVIVTTIVTAMGMARERETGTLEQVLVTPIRPLYLLLGKIAPFVFIGLLDVALVLTAGIYIFDLPLRGKLLVLLSGTLLYLLSTLGVGLFIATVSSTQQQSFLGGFLFAMPAILLSGVMTPIRAMPDWLAAITYLNPVRYYVEVLRAVLLKGAGHQELAFELGALATFGVAIVVISTLRFRKRLQ